jgi:DNA-directed RNA polymerase specialized sigma subunit
MDALKTYDPSKRALNSHVHDWVSNKGNRLNYEYQNLGRLPETRGMQVGKYLNVRDSLLSELGREASQAEVADMSGIPLRDVALLEKELRKDLSMGEGQQEVAFYRSNKDEEILDYIYHDLGNEERVVYEYVYGKHGKPMMKKNNGRVDFAGISSRVGFSESKVRSIVNKVGNKLEKALKR